MPLKPKTVILIKKVQPHAGSHGGAWKVAYADFVTALMALFIVLWLMDTTPQVRAAVAGYFKNPAGKSSLTGTIRAGSTDNLPVTKDNFKQLKQRLEKSINRIDSLKALSSQIDITITPEGLRIELLETKDGSFFKVGSAVLNANGREILTLLAGELGTIPNRIMIEGHTDARPYVGDGAYNNWDLSADRALAARALMMAKGLRPNQVSQVRGYADEMLRDKANPYDPANRRITLVVQYLDAAPPAPAPMVAHGAGKTTAASAARSAAKVKTPAKPSSSVPAAAQQPTGFFPRLLAKVRRH